MKDAYPPSRPARPAWNKGKMPGPKPPLRPGYVWAIRAKLQLEKRTRDLAMFNLAIDSKLRGCDLVALRVDDVAPNGYAIDRATIRQRKTGRPVRFELTELTRQAVDDYLRVTGLKSGDYLFPGRRGPDRSLTTRQYARLVSEWVSGIGLDRLKFATHSMRRYAESRVIPRRSVNSGDKSQFLRDLLGIIRTLSHEAQASRLRVHGSCMRLHRGDPGPKGH
jgi:integrase